MGEWEKRRVGRTNLSVTCLGLGTATMGGSRIPVTREESENMVRAAWDAGVRYVDTAPFYGVGAAERRVGDALRDQPRDEWVLSTKVGPAAAAAPPAGRRHRWPAGADAVRGGVRLHAMMASCARSRIAISASAWRKIDILFVHDIGVYQHGAGGQRAAHAGAARQRLSRAAGAEARRHGQRDRHRREREGGADRGAGVRRLGRVPAGRTLYAAGAGAAG